MHRLERTLLQFGRAVSAEICLERFRAVDSMASGWFLVVFSRRLALMAAFWLSVVSVVSSAVSSMVAVHTSLCS